MWNRMAPTQGVSCTTFTRPLLRDIDLVCVINDNFSVDITRQPYKYRSWFVHFLLHVVELGLGFIPVIGPLKSVSFSTGLQFMTDPEGFRDQNILHLSADIIAALILGGNDMRSILPQSHQRARAMMVQIKGSPGEHVDLPEQEG